MHLVCWFLHFFHKRVEQPRRLGSVVRRRPGSEVMGGLAGQRESGRPGGGARGRWGRGIPTLQGQGGFLGRGESVGDDKEWN